jgi:copper chaperone CopZ
MSQTTSAGLTFEVEEAGCESCAARVRGALEPFAAVEQIDVDHDTELATVRLAPGSTPSVDEVQRALAGASEGTTHTYRVRPGSWIS